jgi:mRNA-degrading endonuclease RelE of RelBE toxin-antitoxin system
MVWSVEVSDKALKHLGKFNKKIQSKLLSICEMFKFSPFPRNCDIEKFKGTENVFRLRKGKIRILYYIDKVNNKIKVLDIDVRGRIY